MRIVTRAEWGARFGRGHETSGRKAVFVVHHDGNDRLTPTATVEEEIRLWRLIENYHAGDLTKSNPRIGYTFGIMPSGRIFEGTGWGRVGAHTKGLNSSAYAVCYPMNGAATAPTSEALAALTFLRAEGVRLGHLTSDHTLTGHQDHGKPSCPGSKIYQATVKGVFPE